MPLKLHEYNEMVFDQGCIEYLTDATNVKITKDLDQPYSLTFEYPIIDDKAEKIIENRIVSVEGQAYRLYDVSRIYGTSRILKASARQIFFIDSRDHHIPTIGNDTDANETTIGVDPYVVIQKAVEGTKFELIPDAELTQMGMTRIGADGLKIDFFPTDKINTYDVITNVIETAGKGELYVDNFRIAVVEHIGKDNGVRLSLTKNLNSLTVQYATDSMITRLYPYGKDDLTINSVNDGKPYIQSDKAVESYGVIEGYRDYSDYTDPEKIKAHAEWDLMGDGNDYRLDTPRLTISCDALDLSKLIEYGDIEKISLGDTVHVYDDKNMYSKRVISITYYPFENKQPTITIGIPSIRNMAFQAHIIRGLMSSLQKNTARGKKIKTNYFTGNVNSTQNPVQSDNELLKIVGDLLTISDGDNIRIRLGNYNGEFVFIIYDKDKNEAIYLNEEGKAVFAGTIETMNDCIIQGALRVGMAGTNMKGIEFYGDAYSNGAACYAKIVPFVANNEDYKGISVEGGELCVSGVPVATENNIELLQKQIDILTQRLDALS